MNPSIQTKLDQLAERQEEINRLLAEPATIGDQKLFRSLSIELSDIEPVVAHYRQLTETRAELNAAESMLDDGDAEVRALAQEEVRGLELKLEQQEREIQKLLIPKDPNDGRNILLEIRAGTGGDEAGLFAGDLFRMYTVYAERNRWKVEILSKSEGGTWWLQGDHKPGGREECLFAAQIRIRCTPRPARTRNRGTGTDPHLGLHGGHHAGGR